MLDKSVVLHSRLLYDSFRKLTGKNLVDGEFSSDEELAAAMYHAPVAIVSHDTGEDPVFNYANETAQILWEMTWSEFTNLPSRFSAEPVKTQERRAMLEEVRKKGFLAGYSGVRISRSGKRFLIKNATLWNVSDESSLYCGQAAVFDMWEFLVKV